MYFEQVSYNLVCTGPTYQSPSVRVLSYKSHKKDSDEDEEIIHVGQYPGHHGNCIEKFGCTVCTAWDSCIQSNDYHGISKRKRRRKKDSNNDGIVSDDEKKLLGQFRQQSKPDNEGVDIGPI